MPCQSFRDCTIALRGLNKTLSAKVAAMENAMRAACDVDDGLVNCDVCVYDGQGQGCMRPQGMTCDPFGRAEAWNFDVKRFAGEDGAKG